MNPKKLLTVIVFFLVTVISNPDSIGLESFSETKKYNTFYNEILSSDYTYVEILINGEWWIRVYDDKGIVVEEYPAD